jgi:hypothetical protein
MQTTLRQFALMLAILLVVDCQETFSESKPGVIVGSTPQRASRYRQPPRPPPTLLHSHSRGALHGGSGDVLASGFWLQVPVDGDLHRHLALAHLRSRSPPLRSGQQPTLSGVRPSKTRAGSAEQC